MKRDYEPQMSPRHNSMDSQSTAASAYVRSPSTYSWHSAPAPPLQPPATVPAEGTKSEAQTGPHNQPKQYPGYPLSQPYYAPQHRYGPHVQTFSQPQPQGISTLPRMKETTTLPQISFFDNPVDRQPGARSLPTNSTHILASARENSLPVANSPVGAMSEKVRVRVNKACERCRLHKIKCTGSFPCSNCERHSAECKFRSSAPSDDQKTARAEYSSSVITPTSDAADAGATDSEKMSESASSKRAKIEPCNADQASRFKTQAVCQAQSQESYTKYLEDRVRYLESVVVKTSFHGPSAQKASSSYKLDDIVEIQRPTVNKWRLCRRHQGALAIELCSSLYKGLSPEAQAQVTIPRTNYYGFNMSGCNYLKPEELPPLPDMSGLSSDERRYLTDFYFREINPLFAILHENVFREQLKAFEDILSGKHPTNHMALFSAMLSICMALSIRFTEFMKPEGPAGAKLALEESLFGYAHKVFSIFSFEWESFELIQCWLLVTLYLRISHRQTSSHSALGNALTMCRSMGLAKYEQIPKECSQYEKAKAKRIFYAVYSFDRIIGVQGGRISGMADAEISREFPSLDFRKECGNDDWMTLPAFAMLHISRLATYLDLAYSNEYDLITAEKMNREFEELRQWLDENGFNNETDIFEEGAAEPQISPLVKAQVKFHFYELIQCIHGKMLFSFFGHRVSIEGMKISTILQCSKDIIYLLEKVRNSGGLFAPWHLTLQLVLAVGIHSLIFVNGGIHVQESRQLMKQNMAILQALRNSAVKDETGKVIFNQRFKMVEECNWLFKMMNHIMSLHYEESSKHLHELGTDHGSSEVNMSHLQFEESAHIPGGNLQKLMNLRSGNRAIPKQNTWGVAVSGKNPAENHGQENAFYQPDPTEYSVDRYLDNLAWFDQWIDFNREI